jgi:hypothetical protein
LFAESGHVQATRRFVVGAAFMAARRVTGWRRAGDGTGWCGFKATGITRGGDDSSHSGTIPGIAQQIP